MYFNFESRDYFGNTIDKTNKQNEFTIQMTKTGEMVQFSVGMHNYTNGAITSYDFSVIPNTPVKDGD